jgi:hypothetical protein
MENNEAAHPLGNPPPKRTLQVRPLIKEDLVIPSGVATNNLHSIDEKHDGNLDNPEKNHSLLFVRDPFDRSHRDTLPRHRPCTHSSDGVE